MAKGVLNLKSDKTGLKSTLQFYHMCPLGEVNSVALNIQLSGPGSQVDYHIPGGKVALAVSCLSISSQVLHFCGHQPELLLIACSSSC